MTSSPSPSQTVKTIGAVQVDYEKNGESSVHLGFRQLVDAMLENNFEGSFSNDCYSDALVLTQKMLTKLTHSLRVLSGGEGDSFFRLLEKPLREALARIRKNGGKAQFILVREDGADPVEPRALNVIAKDFPGVLEVLPATSPHLIAHFIVADDNMTRVEKKHVPLKPTDTEDKVQAQVYFDEKPVALGYINMFDNIWTNLTKTA